jgi:branched-chain amino acid transport system substrate-binding protein
VDRSDPLDQGMEKAFRLAVEEINLQQPGGGQPGLELHFCDMGTVIDGSQSLAAVTYALSQWHIAAVLGPTATADVLAVTPFARDNGVLVISPSATSIAIHSLDSGGMVWRTAPSDALEAARLSQLVQGDLPAANKLDLVYADTLDNQSLEQVFFTDFVMSGLFSVNQARQFKELGADLPAVMDAVAADSPTALVVVSDSDNAAVLGDVAARASLASTHVFMTNSAKVPSLLTASAPPAIFANVRGTGPAAPSRATFALFQSAYQNRWSVDPKDSNFSANAYDAAYLVALAAAATQGHVPSGRELVAGLQKLQATGVAIPVGSADYLQAVAAMQAGGARLDGASGPLVFDAKGDDTSGSYEVWGVDDSTGTPQFVTLSP